VLSACAECNGSMAQCAKVDTIIHFCNKGMQVCVSYRVHVHYTHPQHWWAWLEHDLRGNINVGYFLCLQNGMARAA